MDSAIIYVFILFIIICDYHGLIWIIIFSVPFSPLQSSWWYFPSFAFIGVENVKEKLEFGDLGN